MGVGIKYATCINAYFYTNKPLKTNSIFRLHTHQRIPLVRTKKAKMEVSPKFVEVKPGFQPSERWRIMKNILMIGFAFMIHFTAFMGASNLQSSVNADNSLGTFTLASIYGSLIFSNIFLPVLVIR